jgi:hypothetical protein
VCDVEHYDSIVGPGVECVLAPVGTNCTGGATIDRLPIQPGYWRLDATTTDVRKCPDAETNCSTNFGSSGCMSTSACVGGTDVDALCEASLDGTFCQTCDRSNTSVEVYFVPATDERVAHCAPCGGAAMNNLFASVGIVVALAVALLGAYQLRRRISPQRLEKFDLVVKQLALKNKIKIILGFYMIATRVPGTYDVPLPADVRRLLEQMTLVVSFGMKGVETTPLECMGLAGYVDDHAARPHGHHPAGRGRTAVLPFQAEE